ncbi:hypothetical protein QJS66_02365 [Kocuria rhizophila]|nr:hypothetical protein QJS66_02365 [Kocuria rhizophila]
MAIRHPAASGSPIRGQAPTAAPEALESLAAERAPVPCTGDGECSTGRSRRPPTGSARSSPDPSRTARTPTRRCPGMEVHAWQESTGRGTRLAHKGPQKTSLQVPYAATEAGHGRRRPGPDPPRGAGRSRGRGRKIMTQQWWDHWWCSPEACRTPSQPDGLPDAAPHHVSWTKGGWSRL